ncbi:MAG: tetratricopeptide repeat protein, partial [Anaerolineae bacterium]|nr:tetratricopeptide repeat protein [Anaerolineae bacterium]
HFNTGDLQQAERYYQTTLRILENYYLGLAGMGKVSAAQGKLTTALAYYKKAVEIIPQPEFLAALGDLYFLTGEPELAQEQYDTVIFIGQLAERNSQVYNRQLAYFLRRPRYPSRRGIATRNY